MNAMRLFLRFWALLVLVSLSWQAAADDTDIYGGNSTAGAAPNLLIVIDSAANFSANAANCTYADGSAPTLNGTAGGIEQCALVDTINALPDAGTVNIGLMSYNANNIGSGAAAGVAATCSGGASASGNNGNGGCLLMPFTLMDAAGKARFVSFIKSWQSSGTTNATNFVIKTNAEATGAAVQEAWAYYDGKVGISGTNYATDIIGGGCQKNFMIFIGNAFNSSGTPGDGSGAADPSNSTTGLNSAQAGATTAQKIKLSNTVYFDTATCGVSSIAASTSSSDWSSNWADEWTRLMYQKDASSDRDGVQHIITYAIGVIDQASCKPLYSALLKNMAEYGGGKYFQSSGNANDIKNAILKILNEVQAVNSVFASSSLPVSVNAQGTYLNQIYMGMFRPDPEANPRWLGNLKQYSFIVNADGSLALGDALGLGALSSSGTGFLSPNATSFWTCSNASNAYLSSLTAAERALLACPSDNDPSGGFWQNFPAFAQSAGVFYDLPDGEYVEKGGAAQQIRLHNLTADYTATAGTSTNPRKLYTYCAAGSSCIADLANNANVFSPSNPDMTDSMFGSFTRYKVSSIVRTGTTAVVTTAGNHGFTTGNLISISGADDSAYNVTQTPSAVTANTFTITGLPDYPTTPSAAAYIVGLHNTSTAYNVSSITRPGGSTATNSETATATTSSVHPFVAGNGVTISNASPPYGGLVVINASPAPTATSFTYPVTLTPSVTSANTYTVFRPSTGLAITSIAKGSGKSTVTTANNHGLAGGQTVTISGTGNALYDKTFTVVATPAPGATTFQINIGSANGSGFSSAGAIVTGQSQTLTIAPGNISRASNAATTMATATGITASIFYNGAQVQIAKSAGTNTNESAYEGTFTIACSGTCASFTFSVPVSPALSATRIDSTQPITAAFGGSPDTIAAGAITRSGATATMTGLTANKFASGNLVDISTVGSYPNEAAYAGTWTIACSGTCTTATFGPVTLTPTSPALGASILAYSGAAPNPTPLINWVRGQDNFGDETGPGGDVTMRPSVHGDVLHSRPMVLNYGDTKGVVVFYGDNGGVFHAVNGNKHNFAGTPASWGTPGGEIWGFVPPEVFSKLSRQRINDPDLLLPTTPVGITPAPQKKDYFIDGATGVYQLTDSAGVVQKAVLYLTMRRGGSLIYALDVTDPAQPQVLWRVDSSSLGMAELGQTWSLPKVARVKGRASPVLIFGAGYDTNEDSEPPSVADTMGRGIFILDALTGSLVWSATYGASAGCTSGVDPVTTTTGSVACTNPKLLYAMPSDVTLIDKNSDGYIDRLYVGDLGGNLWRVDLEPSLISSLADTWQINRIASLGCYSSDCPLPTSTTPRKIFFPPEVISASGYDAVFVVTGDREHPLVGSTSTQRNNRVFMLQDQHTGSDVLASPAQALIRPNQLTDQTDCSSTTVKAPCTTTTTWVAYAGQSPGYSITLAPGEKGVNAPLVVAGSVYFGTNQPTPVDPSKCTSNLGEARGYRLNPFTAQYGYTVFDGGGLPPSPVAGVVQIERTIVGADGTTTTVMENVPFAIGTGQGQVTPGGEKMGNPEAPPCAGADCKSAEGGAKPPIDVSTSRTRTYWYVEGK
ncbi:Putative type 4 fimbrial biogenesis pily1-related protein signal peptide [Georgfuchsia toluolica]|uniref:Type 4 fimbrial biogenesis pily1-related protein signal peptide n=1 Tax=Georgfuchsia toluolica TaxID=424218 RepID=A0A916J251_9PROT|nr:PilC/PilY family type IV pilus protein [Georgfuchsia toluolica]CAG4882568.1 Putative type 4 fimbrial biogenesis pily1-related protein signal peptide [Georgfuchsia toluolica]